MTPAPPDPFPVFNTAPLKAGVELYRFHDPIFDGAAYNPCRGGLTRFAPLRHSSGGRLPTLCAATTLEAAVGNRYSRMSRTWPDGNLSGSTRSPAAR